VATVLIQEDRRSVAVVSGGFWLAGRTYQGEANGPAAFVAGSQTKKTAFPKRVLLVEDSLDSVHTLAFLLNDMGHTVEYAINGYVALDVARRFRPDFVLLDLGLPGIDGFEVCRQIKRDADLKSCRVVALTALSRQEYRERAEDVGCELYWVKPVHTKLIEDLLG
jgi:two-component system CheB/CheR fusion protein